MTDNDVLAALDWQTLTCQCEITHHCPHKTKPCTNRANRQITFHALDHCNNPELGQFGNYVFLLCETCLYVLATNVNAHLARLNAYGRAICLSCGAPVCQIDHVIREIEEL
ncbi:hypothetical protein [Mycolicibacterium sp. XJ1819]